MGASSRGVAAQRATAPVPDRVVLHEEPPILSVVPSSALFELERHATREGVPALLPEARHVLRMKHTRAEIGRGHLSDRETDVLEQRPIAVDGLPIGTQDGNRLRNGVDNLLRLLLGRPESFHLSIRPAPGAPSPPRSSLPPPPTRPDCGCHSARRRLRARRAGLFRANRVGGPAANARDPPPSTRRPSSRTP